MNIPSTTHRSRLQFVWITCVFLWSFFIFFQPFGVNNYDPKESLSWTFVYGISLFVLFLGFILFLEEQFIHRVIKPSSWNLRTWIIWTVTSAIWSGTGLYLFYNYLGGWHDLGFFSYLDFVKNMSALFLFCAAGFFTVEYLKMLQSNLGQMEKVVEKKETFADDILVFKAENDKDVISIPLSGLLYVSSDDNYVSIHHRVDETIKKSLLRKSLKSIEEDKLHPSVVRCHRSYLINLTQVTRMEGNKNKMNIFLHKVESPIPVGRSYIDSISKYLD